MGEGCTNRCEALSLIGEKLLCQHDYLKTLGLGRRKYKLMTISVDKGFKKISFKNYDKNCVMFSVTSSQFNPKYKLMTISVDKGFKKISSKNYDKNCVMLIV